jgi:hypothetical protein
MTTRNLITIDRLKEVLDYDPQTGIFTWKVRTAKRTIVGDTAGCPNKKGYIYIRIDTVNYRANVLAWFYVTGQWPSDQIDHENCKRGDNRFSNLREATCTNNAHNRPMRKTNTSGYTGVFWRKGTRRWQAKIMINRKYIHLGCFDEAPDAARAYKEAAKKYHGEFFNQF